VSADEVGAQLGWSGSKVTRIETAFSRVSPADVSHMLDVYGVSSEVRAALLQLAHDAQQRGWWTEFGDVFATSYVALEDGCKDAYEFEPQLVPGLLQTEQYARTVIAATMSGDPEQIERHVRARLARKALLSREDPPPPTLHAIIAEPALRWPIGGPEVMRGQLQALLERGEQPNIEIRVLPMSAGEHAGLDGPFVIFTFGPDDFPDVAYTPGQAGGNYVESRDQVQRVTLNWNRIADKALSEETSAAWIADLI
jgi:hypothetical protein